MGKKKKKLHCCFEGVFEAASRRRAAAVAIGIHVHAGFSTCFLGSSCNHGNYWNYNKGNDRLHQLILEELNYWNDSPPYQRTDRPVMRNRNGAKSASNFAYSIWDNKYHFTTRLTHRLHPPANWGNDCLLSESTLTMVFRSALFQCM